MNCETGPCDMMVKMNGWREFLAGWAASAKCVHQSGIPSAERLFTSFNNKEIIFQETYLLAKVSKQIANSAFGFLMYLMESWLNMYPASIVMP